MSVPVATTESRRLSNSRPSRAVSRLRLAARARGDVLAVHPGEKALDALHHEHRAEGREDLERVLRAWDLSVGHPPRNGLAQQGDESSRLLDRDHRVVIAVNNEEGRGVRPDPAHG